MEQLPLAAVFTSHWRQLILGTFIMLATFTLGYGRGATDAPVPGLGYSYDDFILMMIVGVLPV